MPKNVVNLRGPSLCHRACGQHSSFRRNVRAVMNCWQPSAQFDRTEILTLDLPLQRQTQHCLTNWPVVKQNYGMSISVL